MKLSFDVGQSHRMAVHVSKDDIERFIELSGDRAPLHTDVDFSRNAGYEGPVVHGAFLVALISRLVGMEFPGPCAILERVDIAFRKPCYFPCELNLTATVKQTSEAVASVILDVSIADPAGQVIASGKTWHRILS